MRLLLGSGGFSTPERKQAWIQELDSYLGSVQTVLFIPYAVADHANYEKQMKEMTSRIGRQLTSIHHHESNLIAAIETAESIFIGGGNSFRLLNDLHQKDLIGAISRRIRTGTPYIGVSAGTNMACPTLKTTNDMPIVQPPSFNALGLIPYQINPHYFAGPIHIETAEGMSQYGGETRDDRIREFHEMNEVPVLGLYEGSVLRVENGKHTLTVGGARLFKRGQAIREIAQGTQMTENL